MTTIKISNPNKLKKPHFLESNGFEELID